ncbi:MAG: hypothetical protein FJ102_06425 [Deltaproteobacteria bacterium]|nr:hypothetical protein [Deltaproteobacteria bacterium]
MRLHFAPEGLTLAAADRSHEAYWAWTNVGELSRVGDIAGARAWAEEGRARNPEGRLGRQELVAWLADQGESLAAERDPPPPWTREQVALVLARLHPFDRARWGADAPGEQVAGCRSGWHALASRRARYVEGPGDAVAILRQQLRGRSALRDGGHAWSVVGSEAWRARVTAAVAAASPASWVPCAAHEALEPGPLDGESG